MGKSTAIRPKYICPMKPVTLFISPSMLPIAPRLSTSPPISPSACGVKTAQTAARYRQSTARKIRKIL